MFETIPIASAAKKIIIAANTNTSATEVKNSNTNFKMLQGSTFRSVARVRRGPVLIG